MRQPAIIFADIGLQSIQSTLNSLPVQLVDLSDAAAPARSVFPAEAMMWVGRAERLTSEMMDAMPQLRCISAWGVGYNHIDIEAATRRSIPVCVNPVFARSVAEAALTFIFALAHRLPQCMSAARSGIPVPEEIRGMELAGKIVGIIGFGRIGEEIGRLTHALDMQVLAMDPFRSQDTMPSWVKLVQVTELLQQSDFVVLAVPLTSSTRYMMSSPQFSQMKSTAFLVNIGRGALVDERALYESLLAKHIAGAGLDVWEQEPPLPNHPLLQMDNVIGTPHKLAATTESLQRIGLAVRANILHILANERPDHVVNPEIYT